jgi:hypothetical protein
MLGLILTIIISYIVYKENIMENLLALCELEETHRNKYRLKED